jgi:hypothetical protein
VDATGGTITGLAVGNEVDVLEVYGDGDTANQALGAITDAVQSIGSASVTLVFAPGSWTIDADFTIPANFVCHVPSGCIFNVSSSKTLTFSGIVKTDEPDNWTSGAGTVTVSTGGSHFGVYHKTAAETSAGVTPTNYQYEPGNVLRYGAVGDGSTDDLTAIQNAIDIAATAGGGVVYFPYSFSGYKVSSTIQIKEGVHLTGDAPFDGWIAWATALASGNFITLSAAADVPLLQVASGVDHWGIHNLKFNGDGLNQTLYSAVGLHAVHESIGFTIDGCLFMNFKGYSILKLGRGVCEIKNNTIEGGACFQRMSDMKLIGNNIFIDTTAKSAEFPPLWIGSLAVKNLVSNNFIWGGPNPANLLGADISSISTDTITFASAHGFYEKMPVMITTTGTLPPPLDSTSDEQNLSYTYFVNVVNSTQIKLAKSWANYNSSTWISFTGAGTGTHTLSHGDAACLLLNEEVSVQNNICGNRIEDGYHHATVINGARNTIFTGNYSGKSSISDVAGAAGLELRNISLWGTYSNNTFGLDTTQAASNEDYGILIDSTSYGNSFSNNYTADNETNNILDNYSSDYTKKNLWGGLEMSTANISIPYAYGQSQNVAFELTLDTTISNITQGSNYDVVFDTENDDLAAACSSGIFTAPVAGRYFLNFSLHLSNVDTASSYVLAYIITTQTSYRFYLNADQWSADFDAHSIGGSIVTNMAAGNTAKVTLFVSGGANQVDIVGNSSANTQQSFFAGALLN